MKKYEDKWLEDFLYKSTWATNAIEGNKLTLNQTISILSTGTITSLGNKRIFIKDIKETENGKEAFISMLYALQNNYPFNEGLVMRFHNLLTKGLIKNTGKYKETDNLIVGTTFKTVSALKVPEAMNSLFTWYFDKMEKKNNQLNDVIQTIADFHVKFEMIHPFEDGNGRTGRLLLNYQLMSNGFFPIYFKEKEDYLEQLRNAQSKTNNWKEVKAPKEFIELINELSEREKERNNIFKIEREKGLTQEYYNKKKHP